MTVITFARAFKKVKMPVWIDDLREFSLRRRLPIGPEATMTDDGLNKRQSKRLE